MAVALSVAPIGPADAQTVEQYRARTRRLLDVWSEARVLADSADQVLRETMDVERIRFGTLLVLAHPERALGARLAARSAWSELAQTLGRDTVLLDGVVFYIPERDRPWAAGPIADGRATKVVRTMATRPDILRRQLLGHVESTLSESVDSIFNAWLHGPIPVSRAIPNLEELYVEFITAPSPLVRECRNGDLAACRRALVFINVSDQIREWYDEDGREQLIRGLPGLIRQDPEAAEVCFDRGWDEVCIAILQGLRSGPPPPLSYSTRASLVSFALQRGGDGAYGTMFDAAHHLADSTMVPHVVAAAAGLPIDTLLSEWRTAVINARPEQVTLRLRSTLVAVLWIVGLFGMAMRNTRWR
jgi:hypothetical protein